MLIIYGGARETVLRQLQCDHVWHGPCIDNISRYNKCLNCFCLERDVQDEAEYRQAEKDTARGASGGGHDD